MRELHIDPLVLDKIHPLRKLRWGLYIEQIEIRKKALLEDSRNGFSVKNKDDLKIEHPGIMDFIKKKNIEVYGTSDIDRFSYIPKYKKKKGEK